MRINTRYIVRLVVLATLTCACAGLAAAQITKADSARKPQGPTVIEPVAIPAMRVTHKTNLVCAGFIQYAPAPNYLEIVGGEQEQEQNNYSEGDYVYINRGAAQGIQVGNEYTVARPRGQFKTQLSDKHGWLGVFTQEVGAIQVTEVKENVSVAIVTAACDTIYLGDLLRALEEHEAPLARPDSNPDRFADPSGKQTGRIVLSRDGRELLSRDQIVYVDLGSEDNVRAGDYLTVYRRLGKGKITDYRDDNVVDSASGFGSGRFLGGPYSNESQRVQDANTNGKYGPIRSTPDVKNSRPPMPRKYVGELVILNVQQRTATAVITRVAGEVHTGDSVELQ
ncbi:MAG: hypothetical protein ABIP75_17380 [Pyrinomonadaceae bacterium]